MMGLKGLMVNQVMDEETRKIMKISGRYNNQWHGYKSDDWTPKQKRRMRKKFRKHGISVPWFAESRAK